MVFHLLRGVVHRHQATGPVGFAQIGINIGVGYVPTVVEKRGFAENDILLIGLVLIFHKPDTLKPHQIDKARTIGKMRHKPFFPSFTEHFESRYFPFELDVRHTTVDFVHVIHPAPVDIPVRIIA